MKIKKYFLGVMCVSILLAGKAMATVHMLPLPCEESELRRLINRAAPGDEIRIPACTVRLAALPPSTPEDDNNMYGDLDLIRSLTLQGASASQSIIEYDPGESPNARSRIIHVLQGANVTLRGLTLQYGVGKDSFVGLSLPVRGGGGILIERGSRVLLERSIVQKNWLGTFANGGGIYVAGRLEMNHSSVRNNAPSWPYAHYFPQAHTAKDEARENGIIGNSGGGIYVGEGGTAIISKSSIVKNEARQAGGGIAVDSQSFARITQTTIGENVVGYVDVDSLSADERVGYGGGVYVGGFGNAQLIHVTLAHNFAEVGGGGFYNNGSALSLRSSLTQSNTTCTGGGSSTTRRCDQTRQNCHGNFLTRGNNFSNDSSCTALRTDLNDRGNMETQLQGLVTQGVTSYYPLTEMSSAIDGVTEGSCDFMDDQMSRMITRVYPARRGVCDIGAIEYSAAPLCYRR